jgi:MFS transporter, SP family, galactose:H+ symporter
MPAPPAEENKKLIVLIAAVAATGGLLFGFDTGVISGALLFLKKDFALDALSQEYVVSAVLVGCVIGAATSGRLADALGRKKVIIITACVFAAGSLWASLAQSVPVLLLGRATIGLAIGVASFTVPLYISEISPPNYRGALVSLNQLLITIGIVVSYFVDDLFAETANTWRNMFLVGVVPAVILGVGMLFLPETPRWLMSKGRRETAVGVLTRLMGARAANVEADAIKESMAGEGGGTFAELFSDWMRPALFLGVGIMFVQQATGINTVIYYAPTIFQMAGFTSDTAAISATVGVGLVNVLMTIVSIRLIDKLGRKPLLSIGLIGMSASLFLLGLAFLLEESVGGALKWITVAALVGYIASFAISLGPIAWLLISEIYPLKVRGLAMSVATLSNWGFNFLIALTFLSIIESFGKAGAFWLYAVIGLGGWFFCKFFVPETKGTTLEDIEENLRAGVALKDLGRAR